jgi:hypothetical protein
MSLRYCLVLASLVSFSCAELGEVIGGSNTPDEVATVAPTQATAAKAAPAKTPEAPKAPELAADKTFSHGIWKMRRTARGLFVWSGAGPKLLVLAMDLTPSAQCYFSQKATGPEAQHCPGADGPIQVSKGDKTIFDDAAMSMWKSADPGTPLAEGDSAFTKLGDDSGATVKRAGNRLTLQHATEAEMTFVLPAEDQAIQVQGGKPELFDGCAESKGNVLLPNGVQVQIGSGCGFLVRHSGDRAELNLGDNKITIDATDKAPDLAKMQAEMVKLKASIAGKAQMNINLSGDKNRTVVSATGRKNGGGDLSMMEVHATLKGGTYYTCRWRAEKQDNAFLQKSSAICQSMIKP